MKYKTGFVFLLLFWVSCHGEKKTENVDNQDIQFSYDTDVVILNDEDTIAVFRTELADTPYKRETGLMYRKQMKDEQAMLFIFPEEKVQYFYMKNTLLPLDIIYINSNGRIVSIAKNAKPLDETPLPSQKPVQYVLEIKGGLSDERGITENMQVVWNKH